MTVFTNFRLDENVRRDFHVLCIQKGTTISARLRELIEQDLSTPAPQPKEKQRVDNTSWLNEWR